MNAEDKIQLDAMCERWDMVYGCCDHSTFERCMYNNNNRMHLEKKKQIRKKQSSHEFSIELHISSMNNFELHIPSPHLCVISILFSHFYFW